MRPQTLSAVAELTRAGEPFDFALRSFLDEFQLHPDPTRLNAEPMRLVNVAKDGERCDAFLAATAETLAVTHGFEAPKWVWQQSRTLRRHWFALPWAGLRAILLLERPASFRSRNLFVSANALSRV